MSQSKNKPRKVTTVENSSKILRNQEPMLVSKIISHLEQMYIHSMLNLTRLELRKQPCKLNKIKPLQVKQLDNSRWEMIREANNQNGHWCNLKKITRVKLYPIQKPIPTWILNSLCCLKISCYSNRLLKYRVGKYNNFKNRAKPSRSPLLGQAINHSLSIKYSKTSSLSKLNSTET